MSSKGLSAVAATLLAIIVLLAVFGIFFVFQRGAFLQEKGLIERQIGATGEIPCSKAAVVQLREFFILGVNESTIKDTVRITDIPPRGTFKLEANFTAAISSSCFENLGIEWDFGDGTKASADCFYNPQERIYGQIANQTIRGRTSEIFTTENCTTASHIYTVRSPDDLFKIYEVTVNAFGLRSAFFSQAIMEASVEDPKFTAAGGSVSANYPCIRVSGLTVTSTKGPIADLTEKDFRVIDDERSREILDFRNLGNGRYALAFNVTRGQDQRHNLEIAAIKAGQSSEPAILSYTASGQGGPDCRL